jgi:hypothetical protein
MNRRDRREDQARKRRIAKKRKLAPDAVLLIQKTMVTLRERVDASAAPEVLEHEDVCGWRFALSYVTETHSYMLSAQVKPIDRVLSDRDGHNLGVALDAVQRAGEQPPVPLTDATAHASAVHRFGWKSTSPKREPTEHSADHEGGGTAQVSAGA